MRTFEHKQFVPAMRPPMEFFECRKRHERPADHMGKG